MIPQSVLPVSFKKISLSHLIGDQRLPFDFYILLDGHYLLYRREGQVMEKEILAKLEYRGVDYGYINEDDLERYFEMLQRKLTVLPGSQNVTSEERAEVLMKTLHTCAEEAFNDPANETALEGMNFTSEALVQMMEKRYSAFLNLFIHMQRDSRPNQIRYQVRHSGKVATLMAGFCRFLGDFDGDTVMELASGALFHDIGTAGMGDLVEKPGKLSPDEWTAMKSHPERGIHILENSRFTTEPMIHLVLYHHVLDDGGGYPEVGIPAKFLTLPVLSLAFCDQFAAMTSHRPHQKALGPYQALQILGERFAGEHLDVYKAFLYFLKEMPK